MSLKLEELVGKPITEAQFDEAAGKKDACYHKVKARYDVWPSAYASGALVKCRKVGAANWGNKSKKEGVNEGKFRVHFDLNPDASPAQRLGLMSVEVTAKDKKEAEKMVADKFVGGMKLIRKNMTKKLKEGSYEEKQIINQLKGDDLTLQIKSSKGKTNFLKLTPEAAKKIAKIMKTMIPESVNEAPKIDSKLLNRLKSLNDEIYKLLANYRTVPKIDKVIGAWMKGLHRSIDRLNIKMKEGVNEEKKFSKSLVDKAIRIAKSMSGNMTGAVKKINSMKKGLSKNGKVAYALRVANESVDQDVFFESITEGNLTTTHIHWESNGKGHGYTVEYVNDGKLNEAEYQGRKVKLGKVMQGDAKKFKVYVKNPKGNVVKVNFGQGGDAKGGTMRIRKSNPKARANFRARHNCDNPGPRHKARYWSCKKW